MKNTATKKFVVALVAIAMLMGLQLAFADGQSSNNAYHNPVDTSINLDATLLVGAGLYGSGLLMSSVSKALKRA